MESGDLIKKVNLSESAHLATLENRWKGEARLNWGQPITRLVFIVAERRGRIFQIFFPIPQPESRLLRSQHGNYPLLIYLGYL